jgi:hypothetical protein
MTHTRQMHDDEGTFGNWRPIGESACVKPVAATGLPCGHPVEMREWESHDGAYTDFQFRCNGGGHVWWVDGIDS